MPATLRAIPELLWRPRLVGPGVLEVHLGPTPLAPNLDVHLHAQILVFLGNDPQYAPPAALH